MSGIKRAPRQQCNSLKTAVVDFICVFAFASVIVAIVGGLLIVARIEHEKKCTYTIQFVRPDGTRDVIKVVQLTGGIRIVSDEGCLRVWGTSIVAPSGWNIDVINEPEPLAEQPMTE